MVKLPCEIFRIITAIFLGCYSFPDFSVTLCQIPQDFHFTGLIAREPPLHDVS